jgi:hypothetical protein
MFLMEKKMKKTPIGETACREYLAAGNAITSVEASILFGVGHLSRLISRMRSEGYVIKSKNCTYAAVLVRVNQFVKLTPPPNLPIREIIFTEYWLSK